MTTDTQTTEHTPQSPQGRTEAAPASCCTTTEQTTCCEPSAKADCCGTTADTAAASSCGCR